jgi:DNA (cytosine-5)-methyltransferase 1
MTNKLRLVDLFAGTGAFTHAFVETGEVDVVFANDMNPYSKFIYDSNFNHSIELDTRDINDIPVEQIPAHDILTGGFPCQPFSVAGEQKGFNDKRSNVFWKILEIIDYHKPKCILLENVKNLISHDNRNTFNIIKNNLEQKGYVIIHKVLNTADVTGIPQHRERIYILCIRSDIYHTNTNIDTILEFPNMMKQCISELLEINIPQKYYYTNKSSIYNSLINSIIKKNTIYQYRRNYIRENKSQVCPTLTANMGTGGNNVPLILDDNGIRKLTPRECFNFQGFPSNYKLHQIADSHLYKLAGNAVSVPVVQKIAHRLINLFLNNIEL